MSEMKGPDALQDMCQRYVVCYPATQLHHATGEGTTAAQQEPGLDIQGSHLQGEGRGGELPVKLILSCITF